MTSHDIPIPRHIGIFIPTEIDQIEELSLLEVYLLSWIDALYCPKRGGCFASNEYLGKKCRGVKENTIAKAITKLRQMRLIEDVSFNGRERVIRALIGKKINEVQDKKSQSNSGLDENPSSIGQKSNPGLDIYPSTPYIENKDEKKNIKKDEASTDVELLCDFLLKKIKEKKPNFSGSATISWKKAANKLLKLRTKKEIGKIIEFA